MGAAEAKPHYHGHRQRLRERFLAAGAEALPDYELLELLLSAIIPQRDTKPLAKQLLARFGSFARVINAKYPDLLEVKGLGEVSATALKVIQASIQRVLRDQAREQPVLSSWDRVLDYCRSLMSHAEIEEFRLLFLNTQHALIADELQQTGTINHAPVYPREVVKRALELGAAAIIMVHNHPSGNPKPSNADIQMTKEVKAAALPLGIELHDHLIIGRTSHTSLRSLGLF